MIAVSWPNTERTPPDVHALAGERATEAREQRAEAARQPQLGRRRQYRGPRSPQIADVQHQRRAGRNVPRQRGRERGRARPRGVARQREMNPDRGAARGRREGHRRPAQAGLREQRGQSPEHAAARLEHPVDACRGDVCVEHSCGGLSGRGGAVRGIGGQRLHAAGGRVDRRAHAGVLAGQQVMADEGDLGPRRGPVQRHAAVGANPHRAGVEQRPGAAHLEHDQRPGARAPRVEHGQGRLAAEPRPDLPREVERDAAAEHAAQATGHRGGQRRVVREAVGQRPRPGDLRAARVDRQVHVHERVGGDERGRAARRRGRTAALREQHDHDHHRARDQRPQRRERAPPPGPRACLLRDGRHARNASKRRRPARRWSYAATSRRPRPARRSLRSTKSMISGIPSRR